jgi:hypothetical protein
MIPVSVVPCIDPELLHDLVFMEKIEGCDDGDDITDTKLDMWTKQSLGEAATTATTEDIAATKGSYQHAREGQWNEDRPAGVRLPDN